MIRIFMWYKQLQPLTTKSFFFPSDSRASVNSAAHCRLLAMKDSTVILLGIFAYAAIILLAFIINDPSILFDKGNQTGSPVELTGTDAGSTGEWDFIGTGGSASVDTYIKKVPGSKLFAFKGAMVVHEHIAMVLKAFADVDTTPTWADLLQVMETLPIEVDEDAAAKPKGMAKVSNFFSSVLRSLKGTKHSDEVGHTNNNILLDQPYQPMLSDVVYQYYTLPWPVAPREFLFRRDIRFYELSKSATAQYVSTEDGRQPLPSTSRPATSPAGTSISKNVIRAESPFTNWLFQDLDMYCKQQMLASTAKNSVAQLDSVDNGADKGKSSTARTHVQQVCAELTSSVLSGAGEGETQRGRRTLVQIESLVDNKGSLPAWFVNYVQRYVHRYYHHCCVYIL